MCGIVASLCDAGPPEGFKVYDELIKLSVLLETLERGIEKGADVTDLFMNEIRQRFDPLRCFETVFQSGGHASVRCTLEGLAGRIRSLSTRIDQTRASALNFSEQERLNRLDLLLKDSLWELEQDILGAVQDVQELNDGPWMEKDRERILRLWRIDYVLRNIARLEVRGRDSAGVSLLVRFRSRSAYLSFAACLLSRGLGPLLKERLNNADFSSNAINGDGYSGYILSYKVAREIGRMGDNTRKLRRDMKNDPILACLLETPELDLNILSHTRWASNGVISEPNAHPQDNRLALDGAECGRICAALNGDIDNFQALMADHTRRTGKKVRETITTDAKIIPVLVGHHYKDSGDFLAAFRKAVNSLEGSFAIAVHHLDEPDALYLALKGSGQSLYIGLRRDAVVVASELYGVVEATPYFIKMNGESTSESGSQGQILVLNQKRVGRPDAYRGYSFDGKPLSEEALCVRRAQITTRDICLGGYSHFFLKEIHDSVSSVEKTLCGRYTLARQSGCAHRWFHLDKTVVPPRLLDRVRTGRIRRVYCIGQGTAAVAAAGVAFALERFLEPLNLDVIATKATELSGSLVDDRMEDCLIVAVSQSGTTCDTNRTVDMARAKGASCISIINRRNSDLVDKSDGVMYTSDGRDVEMSVASTKAFYSQVVAGYLLALYLGWECGLLAEAVLQRVLEALERLPRALEKVLAGQEEIRAAAARWAPRRLHWAVVGSGVNHIAAQELRIKLSELCYKALACDYLEDKKHIDLSSEPFVLVCAAGLDAVNLADAVKEVAIFQAHRSTPVVLASEGAERFAPYSAQTITVPVVGEGLDFIPEVMAGHLFGFYAACSIDALADPLRALRSSLVALTVRSGGGVEEPLGFEQIAACLDTHALDAIEQNLLLGGASTACLESGVSSRLTLALRYLQGKLPLEELNRDFGIEESPPALVEMAISTLTSAISQLTRPVDAIKHQAKTVTVGITREELKLSGAIASVLEQAHVSSAGVTRRNMELLAALEELVEDVEGLSLYCVSGLHPNGHPLPSSTIRRVGAWGSAERIASRADSLTTLKGTKWLCVKERQVFLGQGRSDGRPIAIIPLSPASGNNGTRKELVLLHLAYVGNPGLESLIKALKRYNHHYDRIVAAATEINADWDDARLKEIPVVELFDESLERIMDRLQVAGPQLIG